jgi:hypothetical protein
LAVEGSARGRVVRLLAGIAILAVVLAAGAWLLLDSGDDGPDLGHKLVDGRAFASCLETAPGHVSEWHASIERNRVAPSGAAPTSAHIQMRPYGTITVYPTQLAADELHSRVTFNGEDYAGDRPEAEQWGNVLMTGYGAGELNRSERDEIYACVEQAATIPPPAVTGSFEDCGDRSRVQRLSVRGISCGRAAALLNDKGRLERCREHGGNYTCLSEYLCCMLSAQYMGNGGEEIVYEY